MVKPTLLQNLFNRPTQSYNFPAQKKHYHSQKNELVKIAKGLHVTPDNALSSNRSPDPSSFTRSSGPEHAGQIPSPKLDHKRAINSSADSDEDDDVFYTPTSSPRSSYIQQSPHTSPSLVPFPTPPHTYIPLREPSEDSTMSTTAFTSVADIRERDVMSDFGSAEDDSVFSYTISNSTRITTPVTSDYSGHYSKRPSAAAPQSPKRSGPRSKRSSNSTAWTSDGDWAKDVRWLVPPQSSLSRSKSSVVSSSTTSLSSSSSTVPAGRKVLRHRRSKSFNSTSSSRSSTPSHPQQLISPPSISLHHQQAAPPRRAKSVNVRRNQNTMSAVIEVDEPTENNTNTELHQALMGRDRTRTNSLLHTPSKSQLRPQSSRSRVSSSPNAPVRELPQTHPSAPRSQYTTSSRTVDLPIPTATVASNLPSSGTAGFTSLVLPRASHAGPLKSSKLGFGFGALGGGEVDLTKGGMAQTTMASIEVVRGIAGSGTLATNSTVRKTLPRSFNFFKSSNSKGKGKSVDINESPLTFTSWRKPPGYVGAQGVLVQVWAVGIDGVDRLLVTGANTSAVSSNKSNASLGSQKLKKDGEWTKKADVGFIPGRSFVGRVVECGWDVSEEIMRKNDWVVGLLDVKKCGAMAEFIVCDRRRLRRVPHPRMPANSADFDTITQLHPLSLEELALMPLTGVPARRAVRTFANIEAQSAAGTPRILVLRGQDGVGAMATQMLARRGWRVSVHVPMPNALPTITGLSRSYVDKDTRMAEYMRETEDLIRSWGAEEVLFVRQDEADPEGCDGVVKLMERLAEEGEEFNGILDTVGGKEIWDAGEALLSSRKYGGDGQFTTLVGDVPQRIIPSTSDLFKTGVRSSRTHGTSSTPGSRRQSVDSFASLSKKNKIKVTYAWVIINQDVDWYGEDVAGSLRSAIRSAVVEGGTRPHVAEEQVVPFEMTPKVFVGDALNNGGTIVVRVVG